MWSDSDEDAVFEIEDEGFEEGGEQVTIGIPCPDDTILTFYNEDKAVHLVALYDELKKEDPRTLLMSLLHEFSKTPASVELSNRLGLVIQVKDR